MNKVPKLRFPEFSREWEEKKFGDITKINQGLQIPISERFLENGENRYFYITNEFLREGSEKKYYIENPSESVICTIEDILMTRTGNTGQVVTGVEGAFHNNFFKIKYDKIFIDRMFLYYTLTSNKIQNTILKLAGASTIPDLNHGDFYKIKSFYPSLPEQQEIASFLSSVDSKVEKLKRKKELWEQYKKGMMQKIFSQKIRFKDENGNDYPDWKDKPLGEVLTIGNGKDYKHLNEGDIPVFGTGGYMASVDDYLYEGETVFIGRKGTINKPFYHNGKFWTVDTLFYTYKFKNVYPKFIYAVFQNIDWLKYNEASGVPSLSKSTINEIQINFPSLPEQEKIADFLSAIDEKIETIVHELESNREFKKGLLQQMFV